MSNCQGVGYGCPYLAKQKCCTATVHGSDKGICGGNMGGCIQAGSSVAQDHAVCPARRCPALTNYFNNHGNNCEQRGCCLTVAKCCPPQTCHPALCVCVQNYINYVQAGHQNLHCDCGCKSGKRCTCGKICQCGTCNCRNVESCNSCETEEQQQPSFCKKEEAKKECKCEDCKCTDCACGKEGGEYECDQDCKCDDQ